MAETTRQNKECVEVGLVYEYTETDYPKQCSPCFLIAKLGSTAKRLVVDYKMVYQEIKLHSGLLPLMDADTKLKWTSGPASRKLT